MYFKNVFSQMRGESRLWQTQAAPTGMEDMLPYPNTFSACAALSQAIGAPSMALKGKRRASDKLHDLVGEAMNQTGVRARHLRGMAGQCLKWSHYLAPAIGTLAGTPAWPTIGQFWKLDTRVFGPSWPTLHQMWKQGVHADDLMVQGAEGLNWHAWITLATGEIIDLTFPSTLASIHPSTYGMLAGRVACGLPDEIFPDHRYYPMLAGTSVIESMQAKSTLPFLAENVDDLATVTGALFRLSAS